MNRCSIWYRLVFVLNLCLKAFKSYGLLFRDIREERKMIVCDMQLKTAYKSPCVSSMKLKRSIKIHYVTANRFVYILGQANLYHRNCGSLLA